MVFITKRIHSGPTRPRSLATPNPVLVVGVEIVMCQRMSIWTGN